MKKLIHAFGVAFDGILCAFKEEYNIRIHTIAALIVIVLGIWLEVSTTEWSLLLISIGMVVTAELLNTAVERLADSVTREKNPLIKQAKDIAAGGVLIAAIVALILGIFIFLPKLWLLL